MELTFCIPVLQEMAQSNFAIVRFALLFKEFAVGPDPARLLQFWTEKIPYQYDDATKGFVKTCLVNGHPHRETGPALIIRYPLELYNVDTSHAGKIQEPRTPNAGRLVRANKPPLICYGDSACSEEQWKEWQTTSKENSPGYST